MSRRGRHLLIEYTGCDPRSLNDRAHIEALMILAARAASARLVASVFRPFAPQGVTGVVVVEESHLSIHTWPEHGYAAVDVFTCGRCLPERAHDVIAAGLGARRCEIMEVDRGEGRPGRTLRLRGHHTEVPQTSAGRTSDASRAARPKASSFAGRSTI